MPKKVFGKTPGQQAAAIKRQLEALPVRIGNLGVKHFKKNIEEAGWEGQKWPKRKDDLPHPLLQKLRRLYRSIKKETKKNQVRVYIGAEAAVYGKAHNEGYKGTVRATSSKGKPYTRNMNLPKRQFIGPSDKLDKQANQMVVDTINKILKG